MNPEPRVTIVTPCRNSAAVLAGCLESVASQQTRCGHLVIDSASRDGTAELVAAAQSRSGMHGALRFVSEPDSGPYDAMNKGIRFAGGEVIGILNADDRYTDGKVVTDVLAAMNDAGAGACYGDLVFVNPAGRVTRYWKAGIYKRNRFLNGWMPPHPTFFVRRDVYERFGVFRTDIGSAADYELMLRFLFLHEVRCAYVPRVIVRMRLGGISTATVAGRLRAHAGDRTAWKVNGLTPRPWTIPLKPLRKLPQWFVRRPAAGGHGTQ